MIETKVFYGTEARKAIQTGVNKAANAVKVTLGGRGRNVLYSKALQTQNGIKFYDGRITKDGVTVLRNFSLSDRIEDNGADVVRQASQKTYETVGDGTTTSAIFVQAIYNEGLKLIDAGANPIEIKKGIDKAVEYVVGELAKMAIQIGDDNEKIKQIATVSANNDEVIGQLIADAYKQIGKDGIIDIQDAKGVTTEIKVVNGFEIRQGYVSPFFITNRGKGIAELVNPVILFFEKSIVQMQPLIPLLEAAVKNNSPLLIFCEDLEGEALSTLAVNVAEGRIKACVVKSPYFDEKQIDAMEDMATLTGGTFINAQKGIPLESVTLNKCGQAAKVTISKDTTTIVGGKGSKESIDLLVSSLKEKMNETTDIHTKKYLENRIAKLTSGVAILYVGAATESEASEKKDRCDDAVRATRAAIEEGYVAGGGTAFLKIPLLRSELTSDEYRGTELIYNILITPLEQICLNAGIKNADEILKNVINGDANDGYNVLTERVENLIETGIIDPVKVLRCSLQNAASAAGSYLTMECAIIDEFKN